MIELSPIATTFTPLTFASFRYRPGEQAALVRALLGNASAASIGADERALDAARAQLATGPVVVIVGRASLADSAAPVNDAVALLAGLDNVRFLPVLRRGNVRGALEAGCAPGLLPGRRTLASPTEALLGSWERVPTERGLDARGILEAAADGHINCLVLLGADPLSDVPDRDLARRALIGARRVIAVDAHRSPSTAYADVVLAASAYGEKSGTTTNLEGRVSRVVQKVIAKGTTRPDWIIATELARHLEADLGLESPEAIWAEFTAVAPSHAAVTNDALNRAPDGVLASGEGTLAFAPPAAPSAIPKVDAYALRLVVSRKLYDAGVGVAFSPSLAPLAPGARLHMSSYDRQRLGVRDGVPVRVTSSRAALVLDTVADDAIPRGSAWVAYNQPNIAIAELLDVAAAVTDVRVETL